MGLTKAATSKRFSRLKSALEKDDALVQDYEQQGMDDEDTTDMVNVEAGQVTPVKKGSKAGLIKDEQMSDA